MFSYVYQIPLKDGEIVTDGVMLELVHDRHNYAATASKILGGSLKPVPGMAKINLTLERFAHNLDKLLRMDRLSSPQNGGISCYSAIFGVYASLKKLFDHEKKMAQALMDANDPWSSYKAEREVLCKKSGRPRINAGDCLGLSLEYWMDRRQLLPQDGEPPKFSTSKAKVGDDSVSDYPEDNDRETHQIYSLTIECESSPSSMYSPIRISDEWISDKIEKEPDAGTDSELNNILLNRPTLDWQDPAATFLPTPVPAGEPDPMNLDNTPGRLPNIRFIAKFNPPLTVPWSAFVNIQNSVGLNVSNDIFRATTFVGLALRPKEMDPGMTGVSADSTQELRVEKPVVVPSNDGEEQERMHSTSLYVPRTEYSRTIESLPFSHPRQLVEILPTLRQYAFTTSLLKHTFGTVSPRPAKKTSSQGSLLSPSDTPKHSATTSSPLQLDISLFYALPSGPRLRFDIPYPSPPSATSWQSNTQDSSSTITAPSGADALASILGPESEPPLSVTLDVHANAELIIAQQNIIDVSNSSGGEKGKETDGDVSMEMASATQGLDERVKRIARALDICGDGGVWAEWVRREVARRDSGES